MSDRPSRTRILVTRILVTCSLVTSSLAHSATSPRPNPSQPHRQLPPPRAVQQPPTALPAPHLAPQPPAGLVDLLLPPLRQRPLNRQRQLRSELLRGGRLWLLLWRLPGPARAQCQQPARCREGLLPGRGPGV
jgi:hypothetical protein